MWKTNFDSATCEERLCRHKTTEPPTRQHVHEPPPKSPTMNPDPTLHVDFVNTLRDTVTPPLNVVSVAPRLFHKSAPPTSDLVSGKGNGSCDPRPNTAPLEVMTMSPELTNTLEHIVGQLDILTQVCTPAWHLLNDCCC